MTGILLKCDKSRVRWRTWARNCGVTFEEGKRLIVFDEVTSIVPRGSETPHL
jgi:hypothetical protein